MLPRGSPKAFPFRGIERPENGTVRRFQRDGAGRPVVGGRAGGISCAMGPGAIALGARETGRRRREAEGLGLLS